MSEWLSELQFQFTTDYFFVVFTRLLLAVIAGGLIGYERGRHGRAAGLRTHILISLGSAMASLVGQYSITILGQGGDATRIASQVVSGIGFLCAGIILVKNNSTVTGLTTAAAMWATSTIGLAFGAGFLCAGILATLALFLCLTMMTMMEVKHKKDRRFLIELDNVEQINNTIAKIKEAFPSAHSFDVLPSKCGITGYVGISVNIVDDGKECLDELQKIDHVVFVLGE